MTVEEKFLIRDTSMYVILWLPLSVAQVSNAVSSLSGLNNSLSHFEKFFVKYRIVDNIYKLYFKFLSSFDSISE